MTSNLVVTPSLKETRRMPLSKKLLEYGLPIVIGVGLGLGILQVLEATRSEACRLVERWDVNDVDAQIALEDEIVTLGEGARADLREAFMECTDPAFPDQQVWVGRLLAGKPFLDARFLYNLAREGEGWPRRTASVALVGALDREVDVAVVLPGILAWLEDLETDFHVPAITAAGALLAAEMVPPDRIDALEDALVALADRKGRGLPGLSSGQDGDISIDDRMAVASALGPLISRPKSRACVLTLMGDTDEFEEVRVRAIQTLSVGGVFEPAEVWKAAARDKAAIVRQTTLENLFRSSDALFNDVFTEGHLDAEPFVRRASLWSQMKRGMPTMLETWHELAEDHAEWVRFDTLLAARQFKSHAGTPSRAGHILRLFEESDEVVDVKGSILALYRMSGGKAYGVPEEAIHENMDDVDDAAVKAFMADAEGRRKAAEQYAEHWRGTAVFTDDERAEALRKLLDHPDPKNVERAEAELAKMGK